jgi:two-component system, chemotaxis family, protein-glutamate methylesterase/glutaminase
MNAAPLIEAPCGAAVSLGAAAPLRVLICDDSPTYAAGLRRVLETGSRIEVIGVCPTAQSMLAAILSLRPELVILDVELPGLNPAAAVAEIMRHYPVPIVVLSSQTGRGVDAAAAARAAGAAAACCKDDLELREPAGPAAADFRLLLRAIAACAARRPSSSTP